MKHILTGLLVSAFLLSGIVTADDCTNTQKNYPLLNVSKLENFKVELSDKQKTKIDKSVDKANRNIEKLVNKMEKTKVKIDKLNADTKKKKDEKLAQLQELNTQLTQYKVEIVRTTKEHKDNVMDILTDEQTETLQAQMAHPEN